MLAPACERCGCALDAQAVTTAAPVADAMALPPFAVFALTRFMILLGLLTLYAAGEVGYRAGGVSGAMIAFGVGGFLMLPFVPERLGG
jgi:hypothetical protein